MANDRALSRGANGGMLAQHKYQLTHNSGFSEIKWYVNGELITDSGKLEDAGKTFVLNAADWSLNDMSNPNDRHSLSVYVKTVNDEEYSKTVYFRVTR